jgi:hypothetical protein
MPFNFWLKYPCVLLLKPYYPMFANDQLLCLRADWRPSEREVRPYRWLGTYLGMAFHLRVATAKLGVYYRCFCFGLRLNLGLSSSQSLSPPTPLVGSFLAGWSYRARGLSSLYL